MSDNINPITSLESTSDSSKTDSQITENQGESPSIERSNIKITNQQQVKEIQKKSSVETEFQSGSGNSKNIDWQKLAHKMREHNRKLLKRVFTLEQEVTEAQTRYKEQEDQFLKSNLLVEQQTDQLNNHQEEVAHLLQELESSQQKLQEEQALVHNLAQKVETSKQEKEKLERECSKLQDSNKEKDSNIIATQKQVQELQARLDRQQQNTIKYRAALEKYISPGDYGEKTLVSSSLPKISNSEPIKPWSEVHNKVKKPVASPDLIELAEPSEVPSLVVKKEPITNSNSNWPAPEITTSNKENQPKSIAAVKLPSFPRKSSSS